MYFFLVATTLVFIASVVKGDSSSSTTAPSTSSSAEDLSLQDNGWYSIEGKIVQPDKRTLAQLHLNMDNWASQFQILVNGGEHVASIHEDGTFIVQGVNSGSHVLDVIHPSIHYESARIDITSKGKIRARKVNNLQPSAVTHMVYPLRLTLIGPYRYFQTREQWRITDILFSPMVLMMVLPLVLIVILPKMMSDPETRKEMESVTLPKYEMPEMSEMLTSFFGGGSKSSSNHREENGKKAIRAKKGN